MIRVATCVPEQKWTITEKFDWLNEALKRTECDLFLLPQEYFGGGSMREICRLKGIQTDDTPVAPEWIEENIGALAAGHQKYIGLGASVIRDGVITEDYLYLDPLGQVRGHHSKIALPAQDNITLNGASHITPETDYNRAVAPVVIEELGLRIGTVFCWQVFFVDFWNDLMRQGVNLVVHPIKFAPRAWYKKGQNPAGENARIGFTQNRGSDNPDDDTLGWIAKLKYESRFKQLPIAVTCNTWDGGEQYLALEGWIDEISGKTNLHHVQSCAHWQSITVTEHKPELFDALPTWNSSCYGQFKEEFQRIAAQTMMRKAIKLELRTREGKALEKLDAYKKRPEIAAANKEQGSFESLFEVWVPNSENPQG